MKILFYDTKDYEYDYLSDKIPSSIEPYFFKNILNQSTYIDEKYLNCDALSVFVSSLLDEKLLDKFKNLKYIFLRSTGFSNVDLKYCKKRNISVFNAPNYGSSTVAEYTFALLLSLAKKISLAQKEVKDGDIDSNNLIGVELFSKTIGVIGAGAIGRKVINIAHGFGMEVLVYDINKIGAYDFVEFDELLAKSDFISVNCPLNDTTRGMIDKNAISKMKKEAIIVNTARGEIINTKELYLALLDKKIKGAALDVIECEETLCKNWPGCSKHDNLKSVCLKKYFFIQKLNQLDNVIITPHNAYNTYEAQDRILKITLNNINSSFNINTGTKNLVLI